MRYTLVFYLSLASAALVLGQNPQPTEPAAAEPGVASEWDARKLIDALGTQAQHLKPIVDQVQPAGWQSKGASETYVAQWNTAQARLPIFSRLASDALRGHGALLHGHWMPTFACRRWTRR